MSGPDVFLGRRERTPKPLNDIEKAILTQLARGRSTTKIAEAGIQLPTSLLFVTNATVYNHEVHIRNQYHIFQRLAETPTSYAIRTVFTGLDRGDIDMAQVLKEVDQDGFKTLHAEISSFFTELDSNPAPNRERRYNYVEQETKVTEVLKDSGKFGIENVIHAAAVWKIMQQQAASKQIP